MAASVFDREKFGTGLPAVGQILNGVEHETLPLPPKLVTPSGHLDVFPDVLKFFRFRFEKGVPVLQLDRYIGYLPLNENFGVEISTRTPVSNVERLLGMAEGYTPLVLQAYSRLFERHKEQPLAILDFLVNELLAAFDRVWQVGLLRLYDQKMRLSQFPTGAVQPYKSAYYAGKTAKPIAVSTSFARTPNSPHNKVLKAALQLAAGYYAGAALSTATARTTLLRMREALDRLEGVDLPTVTESSWESVCKMVSRLPQYHEDYADALLLAQMLISKSGISIRNRGAVRLPTLLIDMEMVFERYARQLLKMQARVPWKILNGNISGPNGAMVQLFDDYKLSKPENPRASPDIIIARDGEPKLIIDTKYKTSQKLPDRVHLNQIIAYAVRYRCDRAMILYASRSEQQERVAFVGSVNGISIYTGHIDLGTADLVNEERRFAEAVLGLCAA